MILAAHKICYQPIPKNACTSLKRALYRLEAGEDFKPGQAARSISVRDFTLAGCVDAFIRIEYAEDYHALGY